MGAFAVKGGVLSWPGDLVIAGLAVVLGFLVAAGFVPLRGRGSSWRRPQRSEDERPGGAASTAATIRRRERPPERSPSPQLNGHGATPKKPTESGNYRLTNIGASICALLREDMCRAASLKVRELICPCIAVAADLDGTFAMARMQPCFQVAVKIAAVVAARPRGGFPGRPPAYAGSAPAAVRPPPSGYRMVLR
jgi:hypothetical protein